MIGHLSVFLRAREALSRGIAGQASGTLADNSAEEVNWLCSVFDCFLDSVHLMRCLVKARLFGSIVLFIIEIHDVFLVFALRRLVVIAVNFANAHFYDF